MTDWSKWFDEVLGKAEQLSLFGQPKLSVKVNRPEERQIAPRPPSGPHPTAKPQHRLTVPPKGPKPPPGGGWRRTPSGWARGEGDNYEWQPANAPARQGTTPAAAAAEIASWAQDNAPSYTFMAAEVAGKYPDGETRYVTRPQTRKVEVFVFDDQVTLGIDARAGRANSDARKAMATFKNLLAKRVTSQYPDVTPHHAKQQGSRVWATYLGSDRLAPKDQIRIGLRLKAKK
jgi:hypothetical protein